MPLDRGRDISIQYKVFDLLQPILDYEAGDLTPPPAPKHTTNNSNRPKMPKAPTAKKVASAYTCTTVMNSLLTYRLQTSASGSSKSSRRGI